MSIATEHEGEGECEEDGEGEGEVEREGEGEDGVSVRFGILTRTRTGIWIDQPTNRMTEQPSSQATNLLNKSVPSALDPLLLCFDPATMHIPQECVDLVGLVDRRIFPELRCGKGLRGLRFELD